MNFIQPCFIRKNTPQLRKKLEDIGHVRYPYSVADWDDDRPDRRYIIIDIMYYTYNTRPKDKPKKKGVDFVDCGDNEELFLALAALRDDISENQWFVMDVDVYNHISKGEWFLSTNTKGGKHVGTQIEPLYCHKATVSEIIEHFKPKTRVTDEIPFELFKKLDKAGFTCRKTYAQPTLDDALKWLRDEKSLYVEPCIFTDADTDADGKLICEYTYWSFRITHIESGDVIYSENVFINGRRFDFYEEAAITGIEYALDEIVC